MGGGAWRGAVSGAVSCGSVGADGEWMVTGSGACNAGSSPEFAYGNRLPRCRGIGRRLRLHRDVRALRLGRFDSGIAGLGGHPMRRHRDRVRTSSECCRRRILEIVIRGRALQWATNDEARRNEVR